MSGKEELMLLTWPSFVFVCSLETKLGRISTFQILQVKFKIRIWSHLINRSKFDQIWLLNFSNLTKKSCVFDQNWTKFVM